MTSCFDLDYENYEKINSQTFPQSETDLIAATIGVYHTLGKSFIATGLDNSGWTLNELPTDELNTSWGHVWEQADRFLWTPNNTSARTVYTLYHQGITKATRIIDAFEKSSIDASKKEKYIAELRALRVLYARLLYSMFGPLPIVVDPAVANDVYIEWKPERPTKADYLLFMENELLDVYSILDKNLSNENWGRISQGTALTLLMKIYMNEKKWENAADIAKKIMDLQVYELSSSYKGIFAIENEGASNKEVIFPIQRITSNLNHSWSYFACVMPASPAYKSPLGITMEIWGGLKMPWNFYDTYEEYDTQIGRASCRERVSSPV